MTPAIPTIAEAGRLMARGKLSPVELTRALLDRIKAHDARFNSFVTLTETAALSAARAAERALRAGRRGPLLGIPLGIKDIFETKGVLTTACSRILADHVPRADAAVVRRLHEAGAVMLGKTTTHEFALGGPAFDLPWPPARNPWDSTRFTGGSSSGSGAAIGAGFCLGALGSDTGGSIRLPASYCGVAGIKPTAGLVSRSGVIPLSPSLDTVGPMAWTAEDCAILLDVLAGHDPTDPASVAAPRAAYRRAIAAPVKGLRIGFLRRFTDHDVPVSPDVGAMLERTLRLLQDLGCRVDEATLPPMADYMAVCRIILTAEAYALHEANLKARPGDFSRAFRLRTLGGGLIRAADYLAAQRHRARLIAATAVAFAGFDLLISGATPRSASLLEAQPAEEALLGMTLVTPANVAGFPAMVVCGGYNEAGLPMGVQIIGPAFGDAAVLQLGHHLERAAGTRERRPAL